MKKILVVLCLMNGFLTSSAQDKIERPKLVVGVIVDQMRQEYLYRFYDHFGEFGFKKIMKDGYEFKNAHFNYVPTKTGPGHASVYTGTTPRVHGVIANDWYDKKEKKNVYCVEDLDVKGVSVVGSLGNRSPKNLKSSTITDELNLHFQNRSKVIGISIKDRGAILPAGHNPIGAYWYDENTGKFVTSSYYHKELPKWVKDFNSRKLSLKYTEETWNTFYDIDKYVESAADDRPYEKPLSENTQAVFPYDLKKIRKSRGLHSTVPYTPFGNTMTVDLAEAAIDGNQLGADDITDFLAISFSSPDKMGHEFGPYSKEIQDTYVRLDRDFERLFNILDDKVGEGNWTLFLTADHAIADIPAYLKTQKQSTDYFNSNQAKSILDNQVNTKFGIKGVVENISNRQVFLNQQLIAKNNLESTVVKSFVIDLLLTMEGVSSAYDVRKLQAFHGDNLNLKLLAAGLNAQASGDVVYSLLPGWLNHYHKKGGTNHGTGYSYDTHVPMLFYGWGIKEGSTVKYHPITDIAPTVAALLNIKMPSGTTGQPAEELFE